MDRVTTERVQGASTLSQKGLEELLRLLVTGQGKRVSSAIVDGRTVWIKRMGAERRPLFKRLHALISPLIPVTMLRSSSWVSPEEMAEREARKTAAFAGAGFPTVHVLFQQGSNLALSSASAMAQNELDRLKPTDAKAHDDLLIACAAALGKAHGAGLCHGRPHPRDMILEEGRIGFLDFEEAPEQVMPLADAQSRDVWLMFLQICGQSLLEDTNQRALDAYRVEAPANIFPRITSVRPLFAAILPILHLLRPIGLGSDGKRLLKAAEFLYPALAEARMPLPDQNMTGTQPGQKPKAMQ